MTAKLHIAKGLDLPVEAVTQTLAILARKGSGKTFALRRFAEQLFKAGMQVVIADPKGDIWGMRSSADGRGPGLGFLILGGEHGDLPLEPGSGELVAKLVVEERVSVILDLSLFRKHEVATFMTAFLEALYRLKAREQFRTPVMLLVDEADAVAPQRPQHGEERMLGAIEDIVRRGRQRGIGCTLVTQRSAVLNKNVLTQAQVMIAMRTIAPQDLKAMDEWIDVHGTREQRATLMESLPSLPRGDAWVWSPGWPTDEGIFQRVHVAPIETFDSGATPEPGQKRVEPKQRADVDLEALRRQMAETVERAKASDPSLLRKRVAELERELTKKPAATAPAKSDPNLVAHARQLGKAVEQAMKFLVTINAEGFFKAAGETIDKAAIQKALEAATANVTRLLESKVEQRNREIDRLRGEAGRVLTALKALAGEDVAVHVSVKHNEPFTIAAAPTRPVARRVEAGPGDAGVGNSGLRRMLIALAQRPQGLTNQQLGVRAGVSSRSGTFSTYLGRARTSGWVDGRGTVRITEAGIAALGTYEPLPTGPDLAAYWLAQLKNSGVARMLRVLVDAYPRALTNAELGEAAKISSASGTFSTYLGRLRALELVTGRGELRASEELFA